MPWPGCLQSSRLLVCQCIALHFANKMFTKYRAYEDMNRNFWNKFTQCILLDAMWGTYSVVDQMVSQGLSVDGYRIQPRCTALLFWTIVSSETLNICWSDSKIQLACCPSIESSPQNLWKIGHRIQPHCIEPSLRKFIERCIWELLRKLNTNFMLRNTKILIKCF